MQVLGEHVKLVDRVKRVSGCSLGRRRTTQIALRQLLEEGASRVDGGERLRLLKVFGGSLANVAVGPVAAKGLSEFLVVSEIVLVIWIFHG